MKTWITLVVMALSLGWAAAEDGYQLWLRYPQVADPALLAAYRSELAALVIQGSSDRMRAVQEELRRGLGGFLGNPLPLSASLTGKGVVLVGTPENSKLIAGLGWEKDLHRLGPEGFRIRTIQIHGCTCLVIASQDELGTLYGAFHLLRLLGTHQSLENLQTDEKPRYGLRMLDHWDNLDGSIERGYAGKSLWDWKSLPGFLDPRLTDYARADASLGINGVVLNNVNSDPRILTHEYLVKAAALSAVFRPYGLRLFLSANFGAPLALKELATADPLDPGVEGW